MKKKLLSLALALVLSLSLAVPALAAGHRIYIQDIHNVEAGTLTANGYDGDGWSYSEDTNTLTLSGAKDIDVTMNGSCTVILAPGTVSTLARLMIEEEDESGKTVVTIKGSGELRLQNGDWDYAESIAKQGVFVGVFDEVTLEDGLTMTGGTKIGDSGALTLGPKVDEKGTGWATHAYMSEDTPATYVRIAPAEGEEKKDETPAEAPAETETPAETAAPKFTDVDAGSPFAAAIDWAVENGITLGTTDTTFGPSNTCTVSHILTFLWRAYGKPGAEEGVADRDSAAKWAVEQGMMEEGADVSAACTRAMAVTFLWQANGSPETETEKEFSDVAADAAFAPAVAWAVEHNVTSGTGDGTAFSPDNTCTRGQIVTFLYRAADFATQ